jgi:hypothetical protein
MAAVRDTPVNFKPTDEDLKILGFLKKKLGGTTTSVLRQALRVRRDKESK